MITQSINLNLIPGAIPPRIKVSQYDYGSRTLRFMLYEGVAQYAGENGITAKIQGTKPDGHGFCYDATFTSNVTYSYVEADLTRQMTAVAGAVTSEIVLEKSGEVLGTGNFILDVEVGALNEGTDVSDTEIPAIIDAAETNAQRAEDAADRAEAASAHAPYIGNNEHWYVWDSSTSAYVDSGVDAEGVDGVGIVSITKTGTQGLVDTYTITLSNGQTQTFTVTNGAAAVLPAGGTAGQVLMKNSSTDSDASWKNISTTDDYKALQTADADIKASIGLPAGAGKNLLDITLDSLKALNRAGTWSGNVYSDDKGCSFEVATNSSGYVTGISVSTGSGGATGNTSFSLIPSTLELFPEGNYTISDECGYSGGGKGAYIFVGRKLNSGSENYSVATSANANTHSCDFTVDYSVYNTFRVTMYILSGTVITTPLVFKPMVRPAGTSPDYVPYSESVQGEIEDVWEANGVTGVHNLCNFTASGKTQNNVTFTVNSDKTVVANATQAASADTNLECNIGHLPKGDYILSGAPSGGSATSYCIRLGIADDAATTWGTYVNADYGSGVKFTVTDESKYYTVAVRIFSGYTPSNLKFEPQIAFASDMVTGYQPYAMTNRELTTGKLDIDVKTLSSSDDIDTVFADGLYTITSSPAHAPENQGYAKMLVTKRSDGGVLQVIFKGGQYIYSRTYGGSPAAWATWYKFTGTAV